ncbi:ribosome maturation factor RimP [Synechococcus sp. RSCCF101]|uniref:ribosome maturation factor RimP n=1 Tax=Synechococcus sp. RSCCF101 TaxID=2511069 RepID=UPI001245C475|nr:ribosome maturation factor RimP [Synechococcus sp. RSCCF101]QEY33082.1 ribosome maturation factor RimP [Synechococcus sp. RSCCF101]
MPHPLIPDLERLAADAAASDAKQVCGVHLFTHSAPMTIQVQIRQADGSDVSLDDCAGFSAVLDRLLEASELIREAYVLEISSPGLGDVLRDDRDFRSFRGFPVEVSLRDAEGASRSREGRLLERTETDLLLTIRGRVTRIPRETILQVRLRQSDEEP